VFVLSGVNDRVVGFAFAFSAGASTYVGASDLIPEINHSRNRVIPLLVFGGMLLFWMGNALLAPLTGH
jgi:zinc transporter ZupT